MTASHPDVGILSYVLAPLMQRVCQVCVEQSIESHQWPSDIFHAAWNLLARIPLQYWCSLKEYSPQGGRNHRHAKTVCLAIWTFPNPQRLRPLLLGASPSIGRLASR
eukprot:5818175-Amphidinium_carterae.1